ncbi:hypothetical protein TruAng_004855 [Truncatella angustata]|nr:hypothetical protein TruAng_004855 [Truncatella angustata]
MKHLETTLEAILTRRQNANKLRRLTINDPNKVDFSSNDYLSLSQDVAIQREILARLEARVAAAECGGLSKGILGSGGSRLLDGNSSFAEEIEQKIARFHGSPAGLLFNSAYDANIGLLSCVPQPGDIVLYDEAIHASVHDGMRLSRASHCMAFSHSSVVDGSGNQSEQFAIPSLAETLQKVTLGDQGQKAKMGIINIFICVEGIYSMDGCVTQLKDVVRQVDQYLPRGNGYIIVDEAHSVGVLGERGRGLVCELALEEKVWARVHGFGKAIGCSGVPVGTERIRVCLHAGNTIAQVERLVDTIGNWVQEQQTMEIIEEDNRRRVSAVANRIGNQAKL